MSSPKDTVMVNLSFPNLQAEQKHFFLLYILNIGTRILVGFHSDSLNLLTQNFKTFKRGRMRLSCTNPLQKIDKSIF